MTDELHNHIAAMVCETDAPVKPADEKDAIDIMADLKRLVDDEGDVLARASLRLITDLRARAEAAEAREKALLENNEAERKTLIRHNAAHAARVAELTTKLEAAREAVVALLTVMDSGDKPVKPECAHPFCGDECGTPAPSSDVGELVAAASNARLALAGYVDRSHAIDLLDAALAKLKDGAE